LRARAYHKNSAEEPEKPFNVRGELQLGKVAMPRGPRSEKRPADVIGAGRSAGVVGTARRKGGSG
jgi:hypothetical protein